jgi:hypothetical protein
MADHEPSLFGRWERVKDVDPDEGRRLLHELMGRAARPKQEDRFEHLTPPRQPGTKRRKPRGSRRAIGKR